MSTLVVTMGEDGQLQGYGQKGERAWAKFKRRVAAMTIGETLAFSWKEPRSPRHHRLFFGKLGELFKRQEQFDDEDKLRAWLTVGAGYCDYLPGIDGVPCAIPRSIAWENLDEADFADLHAKVDAFLWSEHARGFLWPHMTDEQSYAAVDAFLLEFDR